MSQPAAKEKIYFPNLDGLRFISFFIVFLFHVHWAVFYKYHPSEFSFNFTKAIGQNGEIGVNFFFVLSGFLITYLLIEEKRFTGKIHVLSFYLRRILRIWPLFYLCVIFGFLVYPFIQQRIGGESLHAGHPWTYFVFLNNFDFITYNAPAVIIVLWSVAIEEQFYLFWPLLLSLVPARRYPWLLYLIIAGSFLFRVIHVHEIRILLHHTLAVIGDMALGGLLAYQVIYNERFRNWITHLSRAWIIVLYLVAFAIYFFRMELFTGYFIPFERIVIGLVFGLIILEQNFSAHSFYKMSRFKIMSRMGVYTYALYCFHVIVLKFTETGLKKLLPDLTPTLFCTLTAVVALAGTIFAAIASYHLFEKRFLRLKDKFAFITK